MRKLFVLYSKKINILSSIIILYSTFLLFNFFKIQVVDNTLIKNIVHKKGWKNKTVFGERGKILDTHNRELAVSSKKYSFWVNTNKDFDNDIIINLFSNHFNKTADYYQNKLNRQSNYIKIEKNVSLLKAEPILKEYKKINGLNIEETQQRFYPFGNLASQAIGYLNLNNEGIGGIEGKLDNLLSGDTTNITLRKGPKGKYYNSIKQNEKIKNGQNITLTIDIELQKILQEELEIIKINTNAISANGIIVSPYTGDILAMCTVPSFNPNNYYDYEISSFKNRVISDAYEPGSTFKIVALSSIIDLNIYDINEKFYCERGETYLANGKPLRDHEKYEDLNIIDIFSYSSNIGMSKIVKELNIIDLYKYCKLFGFGTKTGIPLNDESRGKLRDIDKWSKTSKTYISIGQELSVTNLQLAMSYSAIANGGFLLKPNIIKNISNNENQIIFKRETVLLRNVINKINAEKILNAMEMVINYGTAKNLRLDGYPIGGKTGTAQKFINGSYSTNEFISSFVSIFPLDNPKYVLLISIDSPEYGYHWANESAVPATREIIKRMIIIDDDIHIDNESNYSLLNNSINKIKTNKNNIVKVKSNDNEDESTVPNLRGKSLKEALIIANLRGLKLYPLGISGKIVWQSIKPGKTINKNAICKVRLSL